MDEFGNLIDGGTPVDATQAALDAVPVSASAGSDATGTGADQVALGNAIVQESLGAQIVQGTQQEVLGRNIVAGSVQAFDAGVGQGVVAASASVPWDSFILPASRAAIRAARPAVVGASVASPGSARGRTVALGTVSLSTSELFGLVVIALIGTIVLVKLA